MTEREQITPEQQAEELKALTASAKKYIESGISVLATDSEKSPLRSWKKYQEEIMAADQVEGSFSKAGGVGIICGVVSGGLEVVDVDTKHDSTGSLWEDFSRLLQGNLPAGLYSHLVIAETRSGGKHILYRCSKIAGNIKLANQPNKEAIIETRGEGGYIMAAPSWGYTILQGDLSSIPIIAPEDRDLIHNIARSFDTTLQVSPQERKNNEPAQKREGTGLTPWEDYNQRGQVIELLETYGWSQVGAERGHRINLLRSGNTDSKTSGNFHTDKRTLYIFSSSSEFEPGKGYSPTAVFSLLECGNDFSLAGKRLREAGYGDPQAGHQAPTQVEIKTIKVSEKNGKTGQASVISEPGKTLKVETAVGKTIDITTTGPESSAEVLKVIAMYEGSGKQIYINGPGIETDTISWAYQLQQILDNYHTEAEPTGRHIDILLNSAVEIGAKLKGTERTRLNNMLCNVLNLTPADLAADQERLAIQNREKATAEKLIKATETAKNLFAKGSIPEGAKVLENAAKQAQQESKGIDYASLFETTTEQAVKDEEANQPDSLDSGFFIAGDPLLLPAGAISVFAAATGHGKTLALINTVLNVAVANPEKQYVFFTYEERAASIIQYFLNAYIDINLNSGSHNRRLYKQYFKTGSTQFILADKQKDFNEGKEAFFKTFIETGRILVKYIDYDAKELNGAIEYISKNPKVAGVFIDYFQLLSQPSDKGKTHNSRQEELKEVCLALKTVAVNTGLPVVLAAQFNREVTNLERLHPTHIGEAGDIERIVNTLIGIWAMYKKPLLKGINEGEKDAINVKVQAANKHRKTQINEEQGMYMEILKSRDLKSGGWEIFDYNGNTGRIKNAEIEYQPAATMQEGEGARLLKEKAEKKAALKKAKAAVIDLPNGMSLTIDENGRVNGTDINLFD